MEHEDKHIEKLVDTLMADETLETPSINFTDKVMDEVMALTESKATVYTPLIPKSVWAVILMGVLALVFYVVWAKPVSGQGWFSRLGLSQLNFNPLDGISFDFSSVLMYAMLLLVVMLGIQIPLLKSYFNKRIVF